MNFWRSNRKAELATYQDKLADMPVMTTTDPCTRRDTCGHLIDTSYYLNKHDQCHNTARQWPKDCKDNNKSLDSACRRRSTPAPPSF